MVVLTGSSIRYMDKKLKYLIQSDRFFLALLFCAIGVCAFVLGRYSVQPAVAPAQQNSAGIIFTDAPSQPVEPATTTNDPIETVVQTVVASVNGTKYHLLTCSGAKTINEENKIYFNSIQEAQAAGYGPAGNCQFE